MTVILYARRIAVVNGDTQECRRHLEQACTAGKTFIYIGIKVSNEIYSIAEIRKICHLVTLDELRQEGMRPSNITYTAGFGLKTDPILSYVTLTLHLQTAHLERWFSEAVESLRPAAFAVLGTRPNLQTSRQCRLFYNKNESSARQVVNALSQRLTQITLGGKTWHIVRVMAREDRITQYTTPPTTTTTTQSTPPASPSPSLGTGT